jgi:uncharacterized protein
MLKKRFCLLLAILLIGVTGFAQKIPAKPVPPHLVNDFADILSDREEYALETKLVNYNDTTSTQICVVTVTSLDGTTSDDFAQKLGEKWGVGTKDNNGVVILVKPKTADELGDVSIQVGYGMEPYITDAANYVIRTREMIPAFKEGDYYTGINNAVDAIIGLASGAFTADEYANDDDGALAGLVSFLIVMIIIVIVSSKKGKNGGKNGGRNSFWRGLLWGILLSSGNSGRSSGGSWGGSSWGGGHSGGFGGFGGGHFGGGGGSSKW